MNQLKRHSGQKITDPTEVQKAETSGWLKCRNPVCDYWLSPEEFEDMEDSGYYFSCPSCKLNYPLMDPTPFIVPKGGGVKGNPYVNPDPYNDEGVEGVANRNYETTIGLSMKHQGDIAENLVQSLGEIPGYGKITWWSDNYNDPIDGGCGEWAIEVKALCIDVQNHRFIPGSTKRKGAMQERAKELNFHKGILGLLVMLDYRRSVADIYLMEMPLDPWVTKGGRQVQGPVAYRSHNGQHLIAEIPFDNPFLNPRSDEPQIYDQPDF